MMGCLSFAQRSHAADSVLFTFKPPQVGQQGNHQSDVSLDLNTTYRQAGQLISFDSQQIVRHLERRVKVLEVADDRAMKVEVQFPKATETVTHSKQSEGSQPQAIEGKTYLVERRGENLTVANTQGKPVPEQEQTLVARCMDMVGRTSPLAKYLDGKQLKVGQSLRLPVELATELLGTKEAGVVAKSVVFSLAEVKREKDQTVANFEMQIGLELPGSDTMNIQGIVQLNPETCQVIAVDFSGPLAKHDVQTAADGSTFEISANGTMKVAMRSQSLK